MEIRKIVTELINIGTQVDICYVPSHCEIVGNEIADTLAGEGTTLDEEPFITTLTQNEFRSFLFGQCKKDTTNFPLLAERTETEHKVTIFPSIHPRVTVFMRKCLFNGFKDVWSGITCSCGDKIDLHHIFTNKCHEIETHFGALLKLFQQNGINETNFFRCHDKQGWQPVCLFYKCLYDSPFASSF